MRKPAAAFRSQPAGPAQLKLSTPPNQPGTARLRTRPSLHQSSHLISHSRSLTEIHPSLHKPHIYTLLLSAPHPVLPFQTPHRPAPSNQSADLPLGPLPTSPPPPLSEPARRRPWNAEACCRFPEPACWPGPAQALHPSEPARDRDDPYSPLPPPIVTSHFTFPLPD
jgi:hypothetical protein